MGTSVRIAGFVFLSAALSGCVADVAAVGTQSAEIAGTVLPQSSVPNPVINAFTANPSNNLKPGQPITFQVVAFDPSGSPLQYNWSSTGGVMSSTAGQLIVWTPPAEAGTYSVQIIITNGRGGAVSASQNLTVTAEGVAISPTATSTPIVEPVSPTPSATPIVVEQNGARIEYADHTFQHRKDNGDRTIQRGEEILLQPTLKNAGSSRTDRIEAILTSEDPNITITAIAKDGPPKQKGAVYFGTLMPGASRGPHRSDDGFYVVIASTCPSGHKIPCKLAVSDGYGNRWDANIDITIP